VVNGNETSFLLLVFLVICLASHKTTIANQTHYIYQRV